VSGERVRIPTTTRSEALMIPDHDAYIAQAPEPFQASLSRLRSLLSHALPEADEIVAHNMPGFSIGGVVVAGYAAFSKQCGLYVLPGAISAHAEEIAAAGLKATKTGITFSPRGPIPDDLVERLARTSRQEAGG
jgi:uncharacterized protein YdhG (YjbR/CyaY superfamily)